MVEANAPAGKIFSDDLGRKFLRYKNYIDVAGPKNGTSEYSVMLDVERKGAVDMGLANARLPGIAIVPPDCNENVCPLHGPANAANMDAMFDCELRCVDSSDPVRGNLIRCLMYPDGLPF